MNKISLIMVYAYIVLSLGCEEKRATNKEFWYKYGAEEAASDTAKNKIYIYGHGHRDHRNNISFDKGIIIKVVGGCVIDDKIDGQASGYNDSVKAWLLKGGKPVNTYADYKQFVCDDEVGIAKAWESSPSVEITGRLRDDIADLEMEVRKKKLENIKVKDVYVDVIEIRNDGRLREENPSGTTSIRNLKMKRNSSVPFLLYIEGDYLVEGKQYHGIMIYDFREMMTLRYFSK